MLFLKLAIRKSVSSSQCILRIHHRCCSTTKNIRVRFAPSPTGLLHLGGLRTALYNYLFAKSNQGTFILRIEDTDQTRLVPGAIEKLQEDLAWAGIHPDEGPGCSKGTCGPYEQSKRKDLYKQETQKLIDSGHAYYCFCSEHRLGLLRKEALRMRQVPKYDNKCRDLTKDEVNQKLSSGVEACVRFKLEGGEQTHCDMVYGSVSHDVASIESDPVILKTDGMPTYHLANVVDDHHMCVTHVMRGVEWQPSTAKHLLLYKSLEGGEQTHCDMVYGSVSHDVASIESDPVILKTDGMPTYHLANVVDDHHMCVTHVMRGVEWQPSTAKHLLLYKRSFRSSNKMNFHQILYNMLSIIVDAVELFIINVLFLYTFQFDMKHVNTHACKLNFSQLPEFNRAEFLRVMSEEKGMSDMIQQLRVMLRQKFQDSNACELDLDNEEYLKSMLEWSFTRITRFRELIEPQMMFLWMQPTLEQLHNAVNPNQKDSLHELVNGISELKEYSEDNLKTLISEITKSKDLKYNHFMKTLRLCLTGLKVGPGVIEVMTVLGKDCVLRRLRRSLKLGEESVQQGKSLENC
ncbi:probable glutamate--tRNA ligase, mitochondrial [Nilaparvata lugens]|uniref:probable glutamate--tRNA ligase, mitochondrial n=1 Tax=Nilaparvata lugens TaxID=108931 RepID=UPI00193C9F13|nr:probable glutamate--tRNA ligase, mitochondrial [Nilaparvata lugens]